MRQERPEYTGPGIYAILNVRTDQSYVGRSYQIRQRFAEHLSKLTLGKHHCHALQESWNTHGEGAFHFVVLERCSLEVLVEREQARLNWVREAGVLFNSAFYARGGGRPGWHHSLEAREKMRELRKGRPKPEGFGARISQALKGKPKSPEAARNVGLAQRGKVLSWEHRQKISEAGKGRVQSAETRAKIAAAHRGLKKPRRSGDEPHVTDAQRTYVFVPEFPMNPEK